MAIYRDIPSKWAARKPHNYIKIKLWLETSLKMISQATSKLWKTEAMARDIPYTWAARQPQSSDEAIHPLTMSCQTTSKICKHVAVAWVGVLILACIYAGSMPDLCRIYAGGPDDKLPGKCSFRFQLCSPKIERKKAWTWRNGCSHSSNKSQGAIIQMEKAWKKRNGFKHSSNMSL